MVYRARVGLFRGRGSRARSKMDPFRFKYRLSTTGEILCVALLLAWGMVARACLAPGVNPQPTGVSKSSPWRLEPKWRGLLQDSFGMGSKVKLPAGTFTSCDVSMTQADTLTLIRARKKNRSAAVDLFPFSKLPMAGDVHPHPGPHTPTPTPPYPEDPSARWDSITPASSDTSLPPIHPPRMRRQDNPTTGAVTSALPYSDNPTTTTLEGSQSEASLLSATDRSGPNTSDVDADPSTRDGVPNMAQPDQNNKHSHVDGASHLQHDDLHARQDTANDSVSLLSQIARDDELYLSMTQSGPATSTQQAQQELASEETDSLEGMDDREYGDPEQVQDTFHDTLESSIWLEPSQDATDLSVANSKQMSGTDLEDLSGNVETNDLVSGVDKSEVRESASMNVQPEHGVPPLSKDPPKAQRSDPYTRQEERKNKSGTQESEKNETPNGFHPASPKQNQ